MTREQIYLLNVLRSYIHGRTQDLPSQIDWDQLIYTARIHSVSGILGEMIVRHPDQVPVQVVNLLRRICLDEFSLYAWRAGQMNNLIRLMDQAEIDHLLFKGFVVREYYPIPELRTYGDIDFLIRLRDRDKSTGLMLDQGFRTRTDWEPVYAFIKDQEVYEIHTDVMEVDVSDKADYKGYFSHIWDHARLVNGHTYELDPEYHLIYLLTHIAKHINGSGAGIRMYMDIAVFLQHFEGKLDWSYITGQLEILKFTDFANLVFTICRFYFGVQSPIALRKVPDQVLRDFMDYTFEGGTFGHHNRNAGVISLKQQDRNEEDISRGSTLVHRLFPPASSIESRYTYLQGRHWLLPFAWIHRLVRTRSAWGQHAREARTIMNADQEEVLKLKRIYKEIGL